MWDTTHQSLYNIVQRFMPQKSQKFESRRGEDQTPKNRSVGDSPDAITLLPSDSDWPKLFADSEFGQGSQGAPRWAGSAAPRRIADTRLPGWLPRQDRYFPAL